MSNQQSSFHVIDLKLDTEPSLTPQRPVAANDVAARCAAPPAARCAVDGWSQLVERSDEYLCTGGAYRNDILQ